MKTQLDIIIETKRKEIEILKQNFTYQDFEKSPFFKQETRSLSKALTKSNFGLIAEIKRMSPSAGVINSKLDVRKQAIIYQENGVAAISCLTDTTYFGGSNQDLMDIKELIQVPVLRKEFIIDEIQLFESKAIGADAILLIAEVLTHQQALELTIIAQGLGMEVIMEFHNRRELQKINHLVNIVGVNNRNLKLQITDIQTSYDMIDFLPKDQLRISESGIKSLSEITELKKLGFHGALVGEQILKFENPSEVIQSLTTELC